MLITTGAILILDVQNGLFVGIGTSILFVLGRVFRPRLRELARLPHTDVFVALERYPAARRVGFGIRIFRVDGPVYYGNVRAVW